MSIFCTYYVLEHWDLVIIIVFPRWALLIKELDWACFRGRLVHGNLLVLNTRNRDKSALISPLSEGGFVTHSLSQDIRCHVALRDVLHPSLMLTSHSKHFVIADVVEGGEWVHLAEDKDSLGMRYVALHISSIYKIRHQAFYFLHAECQLLPLQSLLQMHCTAPLKVGEHASLSHLLEEGMHNFNS